MRRTYKILINGNDYAMMTADFCEASCQLILDGASTPFQVADARHRPSAAANLLVAWAERDEDIDGVDCVAFDEM